MISEGESNENDPIPQRDFHKEATGTYIEQTRVLITLASAFVVAPAAAVTVVRDLDRLLFVLSELTFVASVFFGYVVFATIAGNQHRNVFNVHDVKTRISSALQILCFLVGLILFVSMIYRAPASATDSPGGSGGENSFPADRSGENES